MTEKHSSRGNETAGSQFPSRTQRRKHEKEQLQARAQASDQRMFAPINPDRYHNRTNPAGRSSGNGGQPPQHAGQPRSASSKNLHSSTKLSGTKNKNNSPKAKKNAGPKKVKKTAGRKAIKGSNNSNNPPKRTRRIGVWVKRILGLVTGLALVAIIAGCITFLVAYYRLEVPEAQKFANAQVTTVYWGDNHKMMGKFAERNRTIVDTKSFKNSYIRDAVVASEDRTFYENSGIDIKGIARALWNNVRGRPTQGASTLTHSM